MMFKIAVVQLALGALLMLAGVATAQVEPGNDLISFNLGYATGNTAVSGNTADGPVFNFNYENLAHLPGRKGVSRPGRLPRPFGCCVGALVLESGDGRHSNG